MIDRFEELFAQPDGEGRAQFLDSLRALIASEGGPTVLVVLRSDFEPQAAAELGDLWARARYAVTAFEPEELRQAIVGPATAKALFFEPATLVDRLDDELNTMPGAAALLSLTLADLYRQARARRLDEETADRMLSAADYDAIGGAVGVLHGRATQLFNDSDDAEKETIRRIFLRLVSQENDGLKRRRAHRDELRFGADDDAGVSDVLERLVAARLLVVGSDDGREYVEPAHDALVVTWDKQREWLAQTGAQTFIELIRDAWRAADLWERKGRAARYLWNRNPHLPELAARQGELNALERKFLAASSRRRNALRRRLVGVIAVVMAALLAATVVAYRGQEEARNQLAKANSRALATAADDQLTRQLDVSLLLSLAAYRLSPTREAARSVFSALDAARVSGLQTTLHHHGQAAFSADGQTFATAGKKNGTVELWDIRDPSEPVQTRRGPRGLVTALAFGPDGRTLASGSTDGKLLLWDMRDPTKHPRSMAGEQSEITAIAFGRDGHTLASGNDRGTVLLWDTRKRAPPVTLQRSDRAAPVGSLAFSPDKHTLAVAGGARAGRDIGPFVECRSPSVKVWDTRDPGKSRTLSGNASGPLMFSHDGQTLLTGSRTDCELVGSLLPASHGRILLWRIHKLGKPAMVNRFRGWPLAFSPDGKTFASGSGGEVLLWSVRSRTQPVRTLGSDTSAEISEAAFSPDGTTLAGHSSDDEVLLLDSRPTVLGRRLMGEEDDEVVGFAFSPVGHTLATTGQDGTVLLWDPLNPGNPKRTLRSGQRRVNDVAFSPDGHTLAVAGGEGQSRQLGITVGLEHGKVIWTTDYADGTVVLWDMRKTTTPPRILEQPREVAEIAFSPDGHTLASIDKSGQVRLWDTRNSTSVKIGVRPTDDQERELTRDEVGGRHVARPRIAFSPDGRLFFEYGTGLRDMRESVTVRKLLRAGSPIAFSPAARTIATAGGYGGTVLLWNTDKRGSPVEMGERREENRFVLLGAAYRYDGRTLATSSRDGLTIWDTQMHSQLGTIEGSRGRGFFGVAFSPDGETLASAGTNGRVQLWRGIFWNGRDELTAKVCRIVARDITKDEWNALVPGVPFRPPCPDF